MPEQRIIRKKLLTRPGKQEWKLEQVRFINSASFSWSRSNPKSRLILTTVTPGCEKYLLSTYRTEAKNQHWTAEPFKELLCVGDTFVYLESEGNASVYVELFVDLFDHSENSEDENTNTAQEAA